MNLQVKTFYKVTVWKKLERPGTSLKRKEQAWTCQNNPERAGTPKVNKTRPPPLWVTNETVVVITTAQLHSTKPELRFCAGSNPARGVPENRNGEDLWHWSRLEIRVNAIRRSTIPQKQFTIIIIIIAIQRFRIIYLK